MSKNAHIADVYATVNVYVKSGTYDDDDVNDILNQLLDRVLFTKFDVNWYNKSNKKKMNHCTVTVTDREKKQVKVKWSQ